MKPFYEIQMMHKKSGQWVAITGFIDKEYAIKSAEKYSSMPSSGRIRVVVKVIK